MKLPELYNADLILRDESIVRVLNARLVYKKGLIQLEGILDYHSFVDEKDVKDKLELNRQTYTKSDLLSIKGHDKYGRELIMSSLIISSIKFNSLEVEFSCYGYIDETTKFNKSEKDVLYSLGFEGLSMLFDRVTTTKQERDLLGKFEDITLGMEKDFAESWTAFNRDGRTIDFNFALIKSKGEDLVYLMLHERSQISLELYQKIKFSLASFLSFACGNNVVIRKEENFYKDGVHHSITVSGKKVKHKSYSNFIPLNDINFLHENILNDYMETFEVYLFIDEYFDLSQIILLLNQAKSSQVDTSIFTMLIALEKLADKFVSSPFYKTLPNHIIDMNVYKTFTASIKTTFDQTLRNVNIGASKKQIDELWSRIGNINTKGRTEDKIERLLNFAEIEVTPEVLRLFTVLRNKAIHQGEIHLPEGTAYENRLALEMLLNRLISNLIQYRGLRLIRREARKNICEQKKDFAPEYEKYGLSKVIQRPKSVHSDEDC